MNEEIKTAESYRYSSLPDSKIPIESASSRQNGTPEAIDDFCLDDEDLSLSTMLASESALRRLWDTPKEDEAWQDL